MGIVNPAYCTREDVRDALDIKLSAHESRLIDDAVEAASRDVEGMLNRKFYPWTGTRYFDWPNYQYAWPWNLWLEADELHTITTLTIAGTTYDSTYYNLEPDDGPPYNRLSLRLDKSVFFSAGNTFQRAVSIEGVFGGLYASEDPSVLGANVNSSVTTLIATPVTGIPGVGDLITIGSERMLVTGKANTSVDTLQSDLTAQVSDDAVAVADGTVFVAGDVIVLDTERMRVEDITGNTLTVTRKFDGSVLAAHSGSTVYSARKLTVTRGATGTTAASHTAGDTISRNVPDGMAHELAIGEAINRYLQKKAGYARVTGSGDNERPLSGAGLADLRKRAYEASARKFRLESV